MIAPTLARPTGHALADRLEQLGHLYNTGLTPEEEIYAEVDALASGLDERQRADWFEELCAQLQVRDGEVELSALPPEERDPDRVEADARARVDEAIAHLAGWA
ncbi:hypothetical protein [Actinomadura montaniterrae]|uniref:Uncharacterized protein n=1 Tax=Actinomadura montaniterrae TaxID=1803903 RepID=A0A6L3W2D5_9ACTN|nr:hypothetical protein [Actinomadura montaniterrae]KAB2384723.1 hypothetical protein F9B16_09760 [Actinomadura montaniterrae]